MDCVSNGYEASEFGQLPKPIPEGKSLEETTELPGSEKASQSTDLTAPIILPTGEPLNSEACKRDAMLTISRSAFYGRQSPRRAVPVWRQQQPLRHRPPPTTPLLRAAGRPARREMLGSQDDSAGGLEMGKPRTSRCTSSASVVDSLKFSASLK